MPLDRGFVEIDSLSQTIFNSPVVQLQLRETFSSLTQLEECSDIKIPPLVYEAFRKLTESIVDVIVEYGPAEVDLHCSNLKQVVADMGCTITMATRIFKTSTPLTPKAVELRILLNNYKDQRLVIPRSMVAYHIACFINIAAAAAILELNGTSSDILFLTPEEAKEEGAILASIIGKIRYQTRRPLI